MPVPLTEEAKKEQERKLATISYVLPWMESVVASSLPYPVDPAKIRQTLEECKGSVDMAVSQLLDASEEGPEEAVEAKDMPRTPSPKATDKSAEEEVDKKENPTACRAEKASEEKSSVEPGSEPENSRPETQKPRKQAAQRPKRETAREKKVKQKEAAKARKREKNASKKDEGSREGTATIMSGIKELYI